MNIVRHGECMWKLEAVGPVRRRETKFRKMVYLACLGAVLATGKNGPLPVELNAGIAFFTPESERWPQAWRNLMAQGGKVWPSQFEGIIHNAAAGYTAIQLGLIGPQLTLVQGDVETVARLQLITNRSRLMVVCYADASYARAYVLEAVE